MDWLNLAASFAAFFASHAIPARPKAKGWLRRHFGAQGYGIAFSLLSVGILIWMVVAAGRAPYVQLWPQWPWMRWAANLAMPCAVALAAFGIAAPNPLSFDGRAAGYDPAHPGIAGVVRHPLLWALLVWSSAHLLVNGDLAHVILFGSFALFCLLGMRMLDSRNRRLMGAAWGRLAERTSAFPFAALIDGRWRPVAGPKPLRTLLAVGIWLGLLWAHPVVIGVSPLP